MERNYSCKDIICIKCFQNRGGDTSYRVHWLINQIYCLKYKNIAKNGGGTSYTIHNLLDTKILFLV